MDSIVLNEVNKLNIKNIRVIQFIIPDVNTGIQSIIPPIKFPLKGNINKLTASTSQVGGNDTIISIEKCTEENLITIPSWSSICNDLTILQGDILSTSYTIIDAVVNKNDYFRVNVLTDGGVLGLSISVEIKL